MRRTAKAAAPATRPRADGLGLASGMIHDAAYRNDDTSSEGGGGSRQRVMTTDTLALRPMPGDEENVTDRQSGASCLINASLMKSCYAFISGSVWGVPDMKPSGRTGYEEDADPSLVHGEAPEVDERVGALLTTTEEPAGSRAGIVTTVPVTFGDDHDDG
jgi:hypothetical protein